MSVQNNIDVYYEELVDQLKRAANENKAEECDDTEAVSCAIDNELMGYANQAYVLAYALQSGFIKWGEPVEWGEVYDMLFSDVASEG